MSETAHGVKVGDVFVESWGYDQTNVDFYQVTKTTKKMVEIKPIAGKTVGDGHSTRVVPDVGNFIGGYIAEKKVGSRKLVQQYENGGETTTFLTMSSYSTAHLEDPETSHFDTLAAGYAGH